MFSSTFSLSSNEKKYIFSLINGMIFHVKMSFHELFSNRIFKTESSLYFSLKKFILTTAMLHDNIFLKLRQHYLPVPNFFMNNISLQVIVLWSNHDHKMLLYQQVEQKFKHFPWIFPECYDFPRNFLEFSRFSLIFQIFPWFSRLSLSAVNPEYSPKNFAIKFRLFRGFSGS